MTINDRVRVYPVAGKRVKVPRTMQVLPAEGLNVRVDQYWLRRLQLGDVSTVAPAPKSDIMPDTGEPKARPKAEKVED